MRLILANTRRSGKGPWVAEITGTDPQYGLARRFLKGERLRTIVTFELEPGRRYEVSEPDLGQRRFVTCSMQDHEPMTITYGEVMRGIELDRDLDWEPHRPNPDWLEQALAKARQVEDDLSDL